MTEARRRAANAANEIAATDHGAKEVRRMRDQPRTTIHRLAAQGFDA